MTANLCDLPQVVSFACQSFPWPLESFKPSRKVPMAHHHASSWTERTTAKEYAPPAGDIDTHLPRQAFQRPHTSLGSLGLAGHWVGLVGGLLPLALSELIAEPAKYRKAVRFASIGTTLAYEVLYTVHELGRRKQQEAKLAECRSRNVHTEVEVAR
jgi:hypothetical protein